MTNLDFSRKVTVPSDALINVIGEEAVLLNLKTEQYYGLDEIGTTMWQALTSSETIQNAYEKLLEEYDVGADVLQRDLNHLLEELVSRGLLELQGE